MAIKQLRRIKGTQDILPPESAEWVALENLLRRIMAAYRFSEIRTPVFEQTELFARGIGQLTDIVSKEMYSFTDRGKKSITLKPEMTAPVMRAFLENKLYAQNQVSKLFYIAPLFRQENPQAGRLRQFHQFGAEALGSADAVTDVELIDLAVTIYRRAGVEDFRLQINSVGDPACRTDYKKRLQDYIRPHLAEYCEDCQRRFDSNPMRILDCKNENCIRLNLEAPRLIDHLCSDCQDHYHKLKHGLSNLNIDFEENPYLVRGLDYYTRTVFEITSGALGAQNAICGGGRYDLLAEELGGAPTPAIGFASGIERLLMVLQSQQTPLVGEAKLDIYLVAMGERADDAGEQLIKKLRNAGFSCDRDLLGRSVKARMREANRMRARVVLLLGEDELKASQITVKLMDSGEQESVALKSIQPYLEKKLGDSD